jgi:hypothetical protein
LGDRASDGKSGPPHRAPREALADLIVDFLRPHIEIPHEIYDRALAGNFGLPSPLV